jgi:O-acetyl-ADP-ribose deacetylase (regulator of RNase III)
MLRIIEGSILDFEGDAIVNAANSFLNHGGGLAKVIASAANGDYEVGGLPQSLDDQARVRQWFADHDAAPLIATGNAHVTNAGLLPYKGVIHAVGPIYGGGGFCERVLLRSAYAEACVIARRRDWNRVAFPMLSVGIFAYPLWDAAREAALELRHWASFGGLDITVYAFDPDPDRLAVITRSFEEAHNS